MLEESSQPGNEWDVYPYIHTLARAFRRNVNRKYLKCGIALWRASFDGESFGTVRMVSHIDGISHPEVLYCCDRLRLFDKHIHK